MKRRIALLLALLLLSLSTACAAKSSSYDASPAEAPAAMEMATAEELAYDADGYAMMNSAAGQTAAAPAPQEEQPLDASTRKIVYNADMTMTADDPAAAQQAVLERAKQLGGYLADSYTNNDELGAWRCTATLKVPAEQLDALVTAARTLGRVDDYQLSSDDITTRYYDVAARLNSAKAEEKQLLAILEKCETVEDILAVRESLASVRADIESYQGQINLWDNLTSYATLYITINRTPQPAVKGETELLAVWKASDVWNRMSRGFVNGARFVVNAIGAIGIFLAVAVIPAAVLFVCVGLPILYARKRRKERAMQAAAAGEPLPLTRAEKRRLEKREKRRKGNAPEPPDGKDA